jgi:DnaJ like chaperone protein
MSWLGKLIGALIGFWLGRWFGLFIGLILGHAYDVHRRRLEAQWFGAASREQLEETFSRTTFSVMGHLAKADGRVSEAEIAVAEAVMARMNLAREQREQAIRWFQEGKRGDFPLDQTLEEFRRLFRWRQGAVLMFLEIQLNAALADRAIDPAQSQVLRRVFERLGFPPQLLEQMIGMTRGARSYYQYTHANQARHPARPSLEDAYAVLGVPRSASEAEVKKAYRRLMSRHHPDKLASKGVPKEMINLAKEKVQEINLAYDQIMKSREAKN